MKMGPVFGTSISINVIIIVLGHWLGNAFLWVFPSVMFWTTLCYFGQLYCGLGRVTTLVARKV